jgi:hypothetical protein
MRWFTAGEISLETALFYCSNPTEFRLQIEGIAASSDRTFEGFQEKGGSPAPAAGGELPGLSRNPLAR